MRPVYVGAGTLLIQPLDGFKIYAVAGDTSVTPSLLSRGFWERHVTGLIRAELKPGSVFVDVGANIGYFSLLAARLLGDGGHVLAIEPQSRLCALIRKSACANRYEGRIEIVEAALGSDDGTGRLGLFENHAGSATFTDNEFIVERVDVPIRSFHTIVRERGAIFAPDRPVFIKIDAEGAEPMVWDGMKPALRGHSDVTVVMEFSPVCYRNQNLSPNALLDDLAAEGFSMTLLSRSGRLNPLDAAIRRELETSDTFVELVLRKRP